MDNACIIGYGVIGKATAEAFGIKKYYSRSQKNMELEEVKNFKYIFVCLPTPVTEGKYETETLTEIIKRIADYAPDSIIILRSTVYPGYCSYLQKEHGIKNLIFNPEFLSEDTAVEDAKNPQLIVIGGEDPKLLESVRGMYMGRFKYTEPIVCNFETAEFIKLCLNGFFTLKVIFANEVFDYAQEVGANYETFKKVIESHVWGSKNHFEIYHKGGRGAGGKCLKKDIRALAGYSDSMLFDTVEELNQMYLEVSGK